eukprot:COSAG04_NODE_7846_length_1058_cov_1.163712_4_plen_84_part_01
MVLGLVPSADAGAELAVGADQAGLALEEGLEEGERRGDAVAGGAGQVCSQRPWLSALAVLRRGGGGGGGGAARVDSISPTRAAP